ncbi:hypothetical protein BDB00DRAFT_867998 [Zychaea mexicana]|uniref:uncharacterized protein n=1 Tax=Zychaea mexicana TaxID=64656 RepID=UPI0022FE51B9|nr:uncharacterized protein BDB00DRAFT_867998 [Zychaea mexicana]KAI9497870.1 hypothetical protein BDB00DRAFT_867998 [Zychaea mexicana]
MRTISLVNRLKWSFSGNMNPHALVLGDVDNDGENEFVTGNLSGDLAVFKGECAHGLPTFVCHGLGTITCIAIGDVRNCGKNSVVCINAEGQAHIFDIPRLAADHPLMSVDEYLKHGRRASDTSSIQAFRRMMEQSAEDGQHYKGTSDKPHIHNLQKPNLSLNVPVNVNRILIADVDGDSLNELVLARTDRILHAFQLQSTADQPLPKNIEAPASTSNLSSHYIPTSIQSSLSVLSSSKERGKLLANRSVMSDPKERPSASVLRKGMGWSKTSRSAKDADLAQPKHYTTLPNPDGKVELLIKDVWVFDGQITSLATTVHPERPNEPILLVAQPGNTFTIIDCHGNRYNRDFTPQYSPRTFYGRYHGLQKRTSYASSQQSDQQKADDSARVKSKGSEESLATTPKASEGPLSRATRTIRTLLQRGSSTKDTHIPAGIETENIIMNCEGKIQDVAGDEIKRSSYIVQNWPDIDGDDIMGEEESGAVATEIVVGKRLHDIMHALDNHKGGEVDDDDGEDDPDDGNQIGMLSMDGKFTIYNLRTKEVSPHDLFVTHKLFSLATLDISSSSNLDHTPPPSFLRQYPSFQSSASSPQLRFPSPSVPGESYSSNNGSTKAENVSNAASPAFSSSSRLSRIPTNERQNSSNSNNNNKDHDLARTSSSATGRSSTDEQQPVNSGAIEAHDVESAITKAVADAVSDSTAADSPSRRGSRASTNTSSYYKENGDWSEAEDEDENEEQMPGAELFVACAWNGVTYLIDWSQRTEDEEGQSKVKFQLVKFAFEGRVCAFTAGLYAVAPGRNVPCLFYVDFEDQIYVYYDVHVSPGPVTGFIDAIDDDIEEALERVVDIENSIKTLKNNSLKNEDPEEGPLIDLGDGWKGIAESKITLDQDSGDGHDTCSSEEHLDITDYIHECMYGFGDMKDRLEEQVSTLEQRRRNHHLPAGVDIRRLSDLNITIEPHLDRDTESEEETQRRQSRSSRGKSSLAESFAEAEDDDDDSAWLSDALLDSPLFKDNNNYHRHHQHGPM